MTAVDQRSEGAAPQRRLVRPKGRIGPVGLAVLLLLGCLPFFMAFARLLAYPGMQRSIWNGFDLLHRLGAFLNRSLTLEWVPPDDRWTILYLLMLPTAVLLITVTRLTLGIRVLGLRAILIAVGFREIGIVPSLLLIAVVVATVVLVRPATRRLRLPLYARISVISCIAAVIMVAALFLGPWMRSETVWSVAFFPVVILAMLAESIAKTIDQDNALTAAWRLGWTVMLALVIAGISYAPAIRAFALHFPEFMITQLVAIVLVSEFFDFRLLESRQANLGKPKSGKRERLRVAVVRNRWNTDVIGRLGLSTPTGQRSRSVQRVVDGLRDCGFKVKVFEGDISLFRNLRDFLPPEPRPGVPAGLVLNLAGGIQGNGRFCHLPSMLEMAGVAYTGPDPVAHVRMLDRYVLLSLLQQNGLATPQFALASDDGNIPADLQFPLAVRPRCEPQAAPIIVDRRHALVAAVRDVARQCAQAAVIETAFDGPEIRVSLIGNDSVECFPLLQMGPSGRGSICPAPLDPALADAIRTYARRIYIAAGCRDYARIDIRLPPSGEPCILQIHSLGILARKDSFARSAEAGGYPFQALVQRIVTTAWSRYGAEPEVPNREREIIVAPTTKPNTAVEASSG